MKEIRISDINIEKRSEEDNEMVLVGYPLIFDVETTINDPRGSYKEIIKRSALDSVNLNDTRLIFNHDLNKLPLAKSNNTMTLTVDSKGLKMVALLPDTEEARSVYTAIKRNDLSGMSFAFKLAEDGDVFNAETRTRTIHNIEKIYEISIVHFPAYPETSVEARSNIEQEESKLNEINALKMKLNNILVKEV